MKEDVLQYLKDNLYLVSQGNKQIITNKFMRECGISPTSPKSIVSKPVVKSIDMKVLYKAFIIEAEVPTKILTSSGFYWGNRYSIEGEKAFAKVINDSNVDNKILLAATKWYYKQTNSPRKMIGNYFSEGIWESCYDDFVKAIEKNKGNLVDKPVDETKDTGRNTLRL